MVQPSARRAALKALRLWRKQARLADSVIGSVLDDTNLSGSDRAFTFDLFYGTLRNLTLLDFWIAQVRSAKVDVDLRDILRIGLYQILIAGVPEHAAVNESVALASQDRRGFINGVLRAATRRRDELQAAATAQPLNVRTSHPPFLIARWENQFGIEATAALCVWNNQPPRLFARINRLKIDRANFLRTYPDADSSLPDLPNFVEFANTFPTTALKAGHCYIQDPSTRIACELLDPQPGEKTLDACAAPGGKTGYLAELMKNQGTIVACDHQPARIEVLKENLERLSVENTKIVRHDWSRGPVPASILSLAPFDRILFDAPCTNTGVMRRRVDVRWRLQPEEFGRMQKQQIAIAESLIPLLKQGGVLVHSTCSLEPEENKSVVQHLSERMSILQLDAEKDSLPFRNGFDGAYAARLVKTG